MHDNTAGKLEQKTEDSESLRLLTNTRLFLNKTQNDLRWPEGAQFFELTKIDPVRNGALYSFEFYQGRASDCRDYQDGIKVELRTLYRVQKGTKRVYLNL